MSGRLLSASVLGLFLVLSGCDGGLRDTATPTPPRAAGGAEEKEVVGGERPAAIEAALGEGRHVFAFFSRGATGADSRRGVAERAVAKAPERAAFVAIDITDPAARPIVRQYGLDRAPLPILLVLAPNGAVVRAFTRPFQEGELLSALAGPGQAACLKALQSGKMTIVAVVNELRLGREEALKGIREFTSDPAYAGITEVAVVDPLELSEAAFLKQLGVPAEDFDMFTVVLAPPANLVGKIQGPVSKARLVELAAPACNTGCETGCR